MKPHTRLYLSFFGYSIADWIKCEIPSCTNHGIDLHHIKSRGMGGTSRKDEIGNIMCLCRDHHSALGDRKQFIEYLQEIHTEVLTNHSKGKTIIV